jgi:hypothetical protein
VGTWSSSSQEAVIATTGASSTQGTTDDEGLRDSSVLNTPYPTSEASPAV